MVSFQRVWHRLYEFILFIIHLLWPVKHYGTTGARNPYAVYRAIHGDDALPGDISPKEARERLNKLGLGGSEIPYEKLFDPYYGSCLFSRKTIEEAKGFQHEKIFLKENPLSSVKAYKNTDSEKDTPQNDPQSVQLDGAPKFSGCVGDLDHWDPEKADNFNDPASLCVDWLDPPERNATGTIINYPDTIHPSFDDSVQGPVPDCYFLAALSSIVWVDFSYKNKMRGILATDKKNPIIFADSSMKVYSVSGKDIPPAINTTAVNTNYRLPKKISNEFQGVKTKTGGASWLPYYEKAFLRYLEATGVLTAGDPDLPNICKIPGGDPGETLRALVRKPTTRLTRYYMNRNMSGYISDDPQKVWTTLSNAVVERASSEPANQARRTQHPAVARTYCCSGPDITGDPKPSLYAATAKGVIYDNELIVASHSYSLLGIMLDNNNQQYVILRNPYGENPGYEYGMQYDANGNLKYQLFGDVGKNPESPTGQKAVDSRIEFPSILFQNTPYSLAPWIKRTISGATVVMPNEGKFAIHINDFVRYFQEFDYVIM